MNDYEGMCKKLEKRKLCKNSCCNVDNEYICANNAVRSYVNGDTERLLKLKGESKGSDYWAYASFMFAALSVVISALTLFFTCAGKFMGENSVLLAIYGVLMIVFIVFFVVLLCQKILRYECVNKWGGYIQVAIEEMEYELGLRKK